MVEGRRVLITGGGGFIGTALAEKLADSNRVALYDIDFARNAVSYSALGSHPNVTFIEGDILDADSLKRACKDAQIVVHLAGVVGVQQVIMNTLKTLEVNIQGAQRILGAVDPATVERFVYLSTSEVYGSHAYDAVESENTPVGPADDPRWCYASSKVASEHLVQAYHRERGLPTVIVRPFNVFGPKRIGDHAVMRFVYQAWNQEPLTVHNDGSAIRSWCYIDDFVDGALRAISREDAVGQTFNIGNPLNTVTMYQLASDIIEVCGSRSGVAFIPFKHSDVHLRVPDISHARELLNYEPQIELSEALRETAQWYRKHSARVSPILLSR